MATYNKRGYKAPKPEVEKEAVDVEQQPVEETFDGNSTTANVFNSLDAGASKTEEWVEKNQKAIYVVLAALIVVVVGYLAVDRLMITPKEEDAANEMFQAEQYLNQALVAEKSKDSLFNLALNGGEGKFGFLKIIEEYDGTDAANLAHYFAGTAYLNTGKYKEAVEQLEKFDTKDEGLKASATGAKGDAYVQLGGNANLEQGLKFYLDAAHVSDNDVFTPRFLFKAAQVAEALNKKADALKYYTEIKDKYSASQEGMLIDAYIAKVE